MLALEILIIKISSINQLVDLQSLSSFRVLSREKSVFTCNTQLCVLFDSVFVSKLCPIREFEPVLSYAVFYDINTIHTHHISLYKSALRACICLKYSIWLFIANLQ